MSAVSKADVLETYADLYDVFEDNKAICKELHKIYDRLNTLPSTQSEIVRCKDCRYWEESETIGGKGYCKDLYGFGRWWKSEDFCSYAERKTNEC